MTEKNQPKSEISKNPETDITSNIQKQKSSFKGIILLFTLALCLIIYFIIESKDSWLGTINRFDPINNIQNKPVDDSNKIPENPEEHNNQGLKPDKTSQENIKTDNNANSCLINDDQLTKFAPDDESEEEENQDISPYDAEAESEARQDNLNDLIMAENFLNNLNDYRIYLANVNELLMHFNRHQPYTENLAIVKQMEFPKEIGDIVKMLEDYDKILNEDNPGYDNIKLVNLKYLDKFLKIQKETPQHKEAKLLKAQIEKNMDLFVNYVFSAELQSAFLR